jgi:MFS family permease
MVAAYRQALIESHRNARLLLANSAIMGFAIDGGIYSVIFNLYVLRLAFGPEFVGQVNSMANLAFAIGCLAAGWLGTHWGSRSTMITGLIVVLSGSSAVWMTDMVPPSWRAPWLMVSFVLAYGGLSLYYVNSGPFLIRSTPARARGNVFALQSAAGAIASFAGGLIGGLMPAIFAGLMGLTLMQPGPYRAPLIVASVMIAVALFVILQTREVAAVEPLEVRTEPGAAIITPVVITAYGLIAFMGIVRFLQVAGIGFGVTFFNVYMDEELGVATAQIGLIAATARLVSVPMALIGPSLSRRIGFGMTAILGSALAGLSILPMALIASPAAAGLGFIGLLSFTSMRYPAFYVYLMERTPDRLRAIMNGVNEMAAGLSFALMALAGGYIIVEYGYTAAFLVGAVLTLAGTLLFWVYVWRNGETVAEVGEKVASDG